MQIRSFEAGDENSVVQLWTDCDLEVPWNDPRKDIHRKVKVQGEMFLVATVDETVVGSVMAGYEGHRGWVNYLAIHPDLRGYCGLSCGRSRRNALQCRMSPR
jgi:hypothetical protein